MPDIVGKAQVDLVVDSTGVTKGLKSAEGQIKKTGAAAEKSFKSAGDAAEKAFGGRLTGALGKLRTAISGVSKAGGKEGGISGAILGGLGIGAGMGVFSLVEKGVGLVVDKMHEAVQAASDQNEAMSKVTQVFGDQADVIKAWSDTASTAMGMTKTDALDAAGTLGNLFDSMHLTADATVEMSQKVVQLAADLGSFNNVPTAEALQAIQSGLLGEAEPMRRFGSALSAARVDAYALSSGLAKTKAGITEAVKVQARYALILQDTSNAQGDFARTADGMANSTKSLNAEFDDMLAKGGQVIMQVTTPILKAFTDLTNTTANTSTVVGKATQKYRDMGGDLVTLGQDAKETADVFAQAYYFFVPQDKQIHDFTGTLTNYADILGVTRRELALFTEAAKAAGRTIPQIRDELEAMVRAKIAETFVNTAKATIAYFESLDGAASAVDDFIIKWEALGQSATFGSHTWIEQNQLMADSVDLLREHWKELPEDIKDAVYQSNIWTAEFVSRIKGTVVTFDRAILGIKRDLSPLAGIVKGVLHDTKEEAQKGMADIKWALTHPLKEAKLRALYQTELDKAYKALHRAQRTGNTAAIQLANQLIVDLTTKMTALDQAQFTMHVGLAYETTEKGAREAQRTNYTPTHSRAWYRRRGLLPGQRAAGGPVDAFQPYLVGERGPELVVPRAAATVIPADQTARIVAGPSYTVNVNAPMRLVEPADIGRQMRRLVMMGAGT